MKREQTYRDCIAHIDGVAETLTAYLKSLPKQSKAWGDEQERNLKLINYHAQQLAFFVRRMTLNERTETNPQE